MPGMGLEHHICLRPSLTLISSALFYYAHASPLLLQLRVLEGASEPGALRLRGELLARTLLDAQDASLGSLIPGIDTNLVLRSAVKVGTRVQLTDAFAGDDNSRWMRVPWIAAVDYRRPESRTGEKRLCPEPLTETQTPMDEQPG